MKKDESYKEQIALQKYAQSRRAEIQEFLLRHEPVHMTLHEVIQRFGQNDPYYHKKVFAVLDPNIVASLEYSPIREVAYVHPLTAKRKQWLIDYWESKYEFDLTNPYDFSPWEHEIGLVFHTDYNYKIYDFPSCLIATLLFISK